MSDNTLANRIQTLVKNNNIGEYISHSWLAKGYNSDAHEIITSQGKYVLLTSNTDQSSAYKAHFAVLKCLEANNYKHACRAIHINNSGNELLMTKCEGTTVNNLKGLSKEQRHKVAINVVDALRELKNITPESLSTAFEQSDLKAPAVFNNTQDWQKYVIDVFTPHKPIAPPDAHTEWLEDIIKKGQPANYFSSSAVFHHGDTTGDNIIVDDNLQVYFIDWGEDAKFYESTKETEDFGLAYCINNVPFLHEFEQDILQHISETEQISVETLQKSFKQRRKDIKVADISWAYMMYAKTTDKQIEGSPEHFKSVLDQRIEEYKRDFSN